MSRRDALIGSALALGFPSAGQAGPPLLTKLEQQLGGRIGVAALDTGSGRSVLHRADERFALCSTFKAPLAAAVMRAAEAGQFDLDDEVSFPTESFLPTSPVTRRSGGRLSLRELCAAAVSYSDNTAANLLLTRLGGPERMTAFFRACGDPASRLDRYEMALNENRAGDQRDTTTPRAMARTLRAFLLEDDVLRPSSRDALRGWMLDERNGKRRIRAGAPTSWQVANKPGTSTNGAVNDIAVIWPAERRPILLCVYTNAPGTPISSGEEAIAETTRTILGHMGLV